MANTEVQFVLLSESSVQMEQFPPAHDGQVLILGDYPGKLESHTRILPDYGMRLRICRHLAVAPETLGAGLVSVPLKH